jgi:hypothetical protein
MTTVGWRELVDLPDWGISRLRAKLDTGARTSALHVAHVSEDAAGRVHFEVVTHRANDRRVAIVAEVVRRCRVRSSTGAVSTRYVVRTRLRLGTVEHEIDVTLVDRGAMIHRMLVGRTGLTGVLVDPTRRYLVSSPRALDRKDP